MRFPMAASCPSRAVHRSPTTRALSFRAGPVQPEAVSTTAMPTMTPGTMPASITFVHNPEDEELLDGWIAGRLDHGGNVFARTGYPFTVVDSGPSCGARSDRTSSRRWCAAFANQVIPGSFSCGASAAKYVAGLQNNPCPIMVTAYTPITIQRGRRADRNTFGDQRRNQIYGPVYFNTNLTLMKNFRFPHWEAGKLGSGCPVLQHPEPPQLRSADQRHGEPLLRHHSTHAQHAHEHVRVVPWSRRFGTANPTARNPQLLTVSSFVSRTAHKRAVRFFPVLSC